MNDAAACLVGAHWASQGKHRLAAGLRLQVTRGLRPSEMLNLEPADFTFPSSLLNNTTSALVVRLGTRVGTKAKREQHIILIQTSEFAQLIDLLERIANETPIGCKMFPHTIDQYRREIQKVEKQCSLSLGWTPHSPRSGFASDGIVQGKPFQELKQTGHGMAESSFRICINIIASITILLKFYPSPSV